MAESTISSIRRLAVAVGRSHTVVRRWIRDERWPFGRGPWPASQLAEIQAWANRTLAPVPSPPADSQREVTAERRAKLEIAGEKLRSLKRENAVSDGRVHDVEECELRQIQAVRRFRAQLMDLPRSTQAAAGLTDEQVRIMTDLTRDHINAFHAQIKRDNETEET